MAVVMQMTWDGIGAEEYEAARKQVNWEGDVPDGAMFHVVAVTDSGVRVTDAWESGDAFEAFVRDRLMPGVQEFGIPGQPQVEILPAHAIFAPGYDRGLVTLDDTTATRKTCHFNAPAREISSSATIRDPRRDSSPAGSE